MHLLILPYLDCSDSHAYTISLELCAGFNDSTHKTSLLHFESVILYAPLHKDKLRTTAGDRGGAGLFSKILIFFANFRKFLSPLRIRLLGRILRGEKTATASASSE